MVVLVGFPVWCFLDVISYGAINVPLLALSLLLPVAVLYAVGWLLLFVLFTVIPAGLHCMFSTGRIGEDDGKKAEIPIP
jgi:hypothetical protein